MLRGLYTAATGMVVQEMRQETISNNLNNANTPGYKRDEPLLKSFPETLLWQIGNGQKQLIGGLPSGSMVDQVVTEHDPGIVERTGRPLDMALEGDGYFSLETPNGIRYSRNGHFQRTKDGYLVNEMGFYALGSSGRIKLSSEDITVDEYGKISIDGQMVAELDIRSFDNPETLLKEGNALFKASDNTRETTDASINVLQKSLEKSNVNLVKEMVNMMNVVRTYESNQKVIQAYDRVMEMSAKEIGSLR